MRTLGECQKELAPLARGEKSADSSHAPPAKSPAQVAELLQDAERAYGEADRARDAVHTPWVPRPVLEGVCVVLSAADLNLVQQRLSVRARAFRDAYGLCGGEPFADQPVVGFATAFVVSPTSVVTAAHVAHPDKVADLRFWFGHRWSPLAPEVDADSVFAARRLVDRRHDANSGTDWAVVELDRSLPAPPLPVDLDPATPNEPLYVVGHPAGLPLKVAANAEIIELGDSAAWFRTNLHTLGGSSGSPVLSMRTHQVRGMVVRGRVGFIFNGTCWRTTSFPLHHAGEDVCHVREWAQRHAELPPAPPVRRPASSPVSADARQQAIEFLLSAFSEEELRHFVRDHLNHLYRYVPWRQTAATIVSELLSATIARGDLAALHSALLRVRPGRRDQIETVFGSLRPEFGPPEPLPPPSPVAPQDSPPITPTNVSPPTRRDVDGLLSQMTTEDFRDFCSIHLPDGARDAIRGIEAIRKQRRELIEHYDTALRGLDQLYARALRFLQDRQS